MPSAAKMECTGCGKPITDQVMSAHDKMFHVDCFKCLTCGNLIKAGETFALKGTELYCKKDYDEMVNAANKGTPNSGLHTQPPPPASSPGSRSTTPAPDEKDEDNKKRTRTTITDEQKVILKKVFEENHIPDLQQRTQLAEQTGLPPRVIQVWFQNRRAKEKKKQEQKERMAAMWMNPPDPNLMFRSPPLSPQMPRAMPGMLMNGVMGQPQMPPPPHSPVGMPMLRNQQFMGVTLSPSLDSNMADVQRQAIAASVAQQQLAAAAAAAAQMGMAPPQPPPRIGTPTIPSPVVSQHSVLGVQQNAALGQLRAPGGMARGHSMPDLTALAQQGALPPTGDTLNFTGIPNPMGGAPQIQIGDLGMDPLNLKELEETVSSLSVADNYPPPPPPAQTAAGATAARARLVPEESPIGGVDSDRDQELDSWLASFLGPEDELSLKRSRSTPVLAGGPDPLPSNITVKRAGSVRKQRHMPYTYHGHGEDGTSLPPSPRGLRAADALSPSGLQSFSNFFDPNAPFDSTSNTALSLPGVSVENLAELIGL